MVNALATGGAMVSLEVAQQIGLPLVEQPWPKARDGQLAEFERQAARQVEAVRQSGSGGRIEWVFSEEESARIAREFFARERIDIGVVVWAG